MEKVRMYDVCVVKLGDHKLFKGFVRVCVFFLSKHILHLHLHSV